MDEEGITVVPRPCARCGAGSFDEDYNSNHKVEAALCAEVQLAFGLISWLCHDCRKQWHRAIKEHKLHRDYIRASLRLDFWKTRIGPDTSDNSIDEGIKLLDIVEDLELEINKFASAWLLS